MCAKNLGSQNSDPCGTIKMGEVELSLKEAKIAIDKINLPQYMEASLRILRSMAVEDKAGLGQILEYVNYLIKFATLAQTFRWESLLRYDHAYRKGQSQMAFSWGADSAYLMQLHLKSDTTPVMTSNRSVPVGRSSMNENRGRSNISKSKYDPHSGRVICFRYNGKQGCTLRGCKFAHVCTTCFRDHPDHSNHAKPAQTSPATVANY